MSNFLALDAISDIDSSERSNSYSFVWEPSMESDLSLFHSETSPLFESVRAEKKVNVLLFKLSFFLFRSGRFFSLEGLSANVLNFVLSQVQRLGNGVVSSKFARKGVWSH